MGAKVTVAIVGDDVSSFANSIWAAGRLGGFTPRRAVIVAAAERDSERAAAAARLVLATLDPEGKPDVVTDPLLAAGFMDWGRKVAEVVKKEKDAGAVVALDVTAAPKDGAIAASIASWNRKVDHIFHLDEGGHAHLENPLLMLPLPQVKLHDYVAEARDSGGGPGR
jgi:hypothetical protein